MTASPITLGRFSGPPAEMACATCGRILNTYRTPGGGVSHLHPTGPRDYDHRPVPVPADQLTAVARDCDFCSDPYPILSIRSGPVHAVTIGGDTRTSHNFGDTWAACITCARLVEDGKAAPLARRALVGARWATDTIAVHAVQHIHATVLATRQPGTTLLTTTDWPHTAIPATTLPKTRDAAARLLHADAITLTAFDDPVRRTIAAGLDQAHLYAIDEELTDLAHHAAGDLPAGTVLTPADLPVPHGMLLWARPHGPHRISAASWTATGDKVTITTYRSIGAGLPPEALQHLREDVGWLLPVTATRQGVAATGADETLLTATLLLIAQRCTETVDVEPDQRIARAYQRSRRPLPIVRLVQLRGRSAQPRPVQPSPASATPDRPTPQVRRWISGFWRQQPYGPERSLRRWQYIFAYLRGPDTAPIAASTTVRILSKVPPRPTGPAPSAPIVRS
ncbi:hypothetical protein GCM10009827_118960 [Dactylosporangium maewongense]|uniref:Uncharacterized protein n=1 Tax=Dactylosporangium maewongense TaxID=634393 RepID=A0ABN2DH29_9ACTN